MKRSTVEH